MKYHEDTIAATLKWFEARPLLEDFNEYEEWEDLTPPASDLARAIKYQAQLIRTYLLREADTVEVVTGEPEENDVGMDNRGNFARFTIYADGRSKVLLHWISENRLDGFDEDSYTIIMRNGKVVLDKREKQ